MFWRFRRKPVASTPVITGSIPGFTTSEQAWDRILAGTASEGLWTDRLVFSGEPKLAQLPANLRVRTLVVDDCPNFVTLPDGLLAERVSVRGCGEFSTVPENVTIWDLVIQNCESFVRLTHGLRLNVLTIRECNNLISLPSRLYCKSLLLPGSRLTEIPAGLHVEYMLNLDGSTSLTRLPDLLVRELILRNCTSLEHLPDDLEADLLDVSGCTRLQWQGFALVEVTCLNISGCPQITYLPEWLSVSGEIDIAGTGLIELPRWLKQCRLLWRGVRIDARIAFHPESISPEEIVRERNVERRRVMLERMGWEKFLASVPRRTIASDTDPGGSRSLFQFTFRDGEELLVLSVSCPSTGRRYFLRVPPWVRTCHEAAAWVAGFDDPDEYSPVLET